MDDAPFTRNDPGDMLGMVADLPRQLQRAPAVSADQRDVLAAVAAQLRDPGGVRRVLVCGMGGSAIGGEFAAAWAATQGLAIDVVRDYVLPGWVDGETLLVFSSYSGNTEETLAAYDAARESRGARVALTTGGRLGAAADADGVPWLAFPMGLQPRAALGHSLVGLLLVLEAAGVLREDPVPRLERCGEFLAGLAEKMAPDVPEARNPAKQLARLWHGSLPWIVTAEGLTRPVARRWKGQLNENAKTLAVTSTLPEMNHNEIVGWRALPEIRRYVRLFFLQDSTDPPRVTHRMRLTQEILEPAVAGCHALETRGDGFLERMLGTAYLGDYASVYLAFLNGVDPTPVAEIEDLKQRLAAL